MPVSLRPALLRVNGVSGVREADIDAVEFKMLPAYVNDFRAR